MLLIEQDENAAEKQVQGNNKVNHLPVWVSLVSLQSNLVLLMVVLLNTLDEMN